jgi:predicted small secreted protein
MKLKKGGIGVTVCLIVAVFLMTGCHPDRALRAIDAVGRVMQVANTVAEGVSIGFRIAESVAKIKYYQQLTQSDQERLAAAYQSNVAGSWVATDGSVVVFEPGMHYRPTRAYGTEYRSYIGGECMTSKVVSKKTAVDGTIYKTTVDADACYDPQTKQWEVVRGSEWNETEVAYAPLVPTKKKPRRY